MNIKEAEQFIKANNPVQYYWICFYHKEIMRFSRPCNIFELTDVMGSERSSDKFEKVKLDDHYISYIPLRYFNFVRHGGLVPTEGMVKNYPWYELSDSLKEEGFRIPIVAAYNFEASSYMAVEGKHRLGAASMIKPYDRNRLIPSLVVVIDFIYTVKMYKKKHPFPLFGKGKSGSKEFSDK